MDPAASRRIVSIIDMGSSSFFVEIFDGGRSLVTLKYTNCFLGTSRGAEVQPAKLTFLINFSLFKALNFAAKNISSSRGSVGA